MTVQQCLCQICTCGKHHCPQQSNVQENFVPDPGSYVTEYQKNFLPHRTTVTHAAIKQQNEWQPLEGKMENTTTSRLDYVPHEVTRRSPKAAELYVPPDGTMMLASTYSEDYKKHQVQKFIVKKQTREYCPPATKMVAMSIYKEVFKPLSSERCKPFRATDNLNVGQGKFVTTTTSRDDYCLKRSTSPKENFKPVPETGESLPFDGTTNYKLHYVAHPVQPKPPRKKKRYKPTSLSFHGVSTYMQDYKGLSTEVPKPVKAKEAWKHNCDSFQGTTEFHDQYKPWPLQPKQLHKKENYRPPEGDMALLSTTQADYVAHDYQKVQRVRPPIHAWKKDKEPFQGTSAMKEDYRAWGMARQPHVCHQELFKSSGTFEKTSHRHHNRWNAGEKPDTCTHVRFQNKSSPEPMPENSTSYTRKTPVVCPASFPKPPDFKHTDKKAGHRLYRTISVGDDSMCLKTLGKGLARPGSSNDRRAH